LSFSSITNKFTNFREQISQSISTNNFISRFFKGQRIEQQGLTAANTASRTSNLFRNFWQSILLTLTTSKTYTQADIASVPRISPAYPTNDSLLMGYCNGTSKGGENITYSWKWYNGSDVFITIITWVRPRLSINGWNIHGLVSR
jgi:hypothetical protein